jgi:hypothetical protein
MTRMATASVFRTWADTDAREPVFEEPRNRGWGWEFETRERLADASSGQRQIYADGAGPCRPVKFIPSFQRHSRTKPENLFRFSTSQTLLRRHCFWKLRHVFC